MSSPRPAPGVAAATPAISAALVARMLHILGLAVAALLLVPIVHNALRGGWLAASLLTLLELAILGAFALKHHGHPRAGAVLFASSTWILCLGVAAFAGDGTRDVVLFALAPILLVAGMLVGRRFLWTLTGLTMVALTALWLAEQRGWVPGAGPGTTDFLAIVDAALILLLTATATSVLTTDLRRTLASELRHADALERSELRLRTAIELAAEGILLANDRGAVTEANSRICTMLGRTRGEILGASLFEVLPPDERAGVSDTRARIDRGEVVTSERALGRAGDDGPVVEIAWQRLPDRSLQCFVRDISSRRRLEEERRHGQKMEAVSALAGGIAQDFNNLVTVMQGFLELLEADARLPEELAGHVAELKSATTQAAGLTQQLLAFAGRQPLQRRVLDVNELLRASRSAIEQLAGPTISVAVEPMPSPCPVLVDTSLFSQVLLSLAANSRAAMPDGGRITMAALPPATRTPARLGPEGFVVRDYTGIRFSDTGYGIPPGIEARIFEPFVEAGPGGRSAGLGLALVQGIVSRHGGWAEVESEPGAGTTFTLFLPVHAPPGTASPAPSTHPASGTAPGPTVLVVDDDTALRRLAAHTLTQAGYSVVEADSGPEALQAWDEHPGRIDLVFTDMVMPGGMNGIQLIETCRARQAGIPAILTSGYALPARSSAALPADVAMLAKPYASGVLVDRVRSLLETSSEIRRASRSA